uniref:Uncharacterized protein n=4 Tax=Spongospora subterranea TaxID=70186 RepID=A0A0H5R865_9EUKA|eukprot:CRZ04509.1 hypothetical protein [Spongospora subterranea]
MPHCIAVNAGTKWVRMYDVRSPLEPVLAVGAHTKQIQAISMGHNSEYLLAAASEDGLLNLWDVRISRGKPLAGCLFFPGVIPNFIQWSKFSSNLIATSFTGKSEIEFHDVSSRIRMYDVLEVGPDIPKAVPRYQLTLPCSVSSFDFHPKRPDKLLVLTADSRVHLKTIHKSVPISVSCYDSVAFSSEAAFRETDVVEDVVNVIVNRVKAGYCLNAAENCRLFSAESSYSDSSLYRVWDFLMLACSDVSGEMVGFSVTDSIAANTLSTSVAWNELVYFSSLRRLEALHFLGWCDVTTPDEIDKLVRTFEEKLEFEMAAAIAVFHLDLPRAIASLRASAKLTKRSDLSLVCLAFSGFTTSSSADHRKLWASTAKDTSSTIHPYLRAAIAFLSAIDGNPDFSRVLEDNDVFFQDRLAFACRFLNDTELSLFLETKSQFHVQHGDLNGLICSGLSSSCVPVLKSFLDRTGDIQTVAIICAMVAADQEAEWLNECINVYRNVLDRWRLWSFRAKFDIARGSFQRSSVAVGGHISAACRHCRQSLALCDFPTQRSSGRLYRTQISVAPISASSRLRVQGCLSCKKPLPRCSICLISLDCASSAPQRWQQNAVDVQTLRGTANLLDKWLSWCVVCHHSAHAEHLEKWFQSHTVCPVMGCGCRCNQYNNDISSG